MKSKVINLFGDNGSPNRGVKYAELLEQFIAPFDNDFSDTEYYEDVIDLAIAAWNFGNMKMILPEEESDEAIMSLEGDEVNMDLLKRMISLKVSKFKEFTDFIIDYDLEEQNGAPLLSVVTQEKELYLSAMAEEMEMGHTDDDFEENYINRSAIIIKPLQPFMDWFIHLYPGEEEGLNASMTYLIRSDIDDVEVWLDKTFDQIFTRELEGWHTNEKEWPQKRTVTMFKEWFQVDISTMVYDLEAAPVFKEM